MAFLLRLGQYLNSSRDPKNFWQNVIFSLRAEHLDLPFAVLYSVEGDFNETESEMSDQSNHNRSWTLEGRIRVPDSYSNVPIQATEQAMEDLLSTFSELVRAEGPTLLLAENGTLPEFIARDIPVMDNEPAQAAVFLPIRTTGENVLGFLILGLNPRKRFDGDYKVFVELLNRQLNTSLAVRNLRSLFPVVITDSHVVRRSVRRRDQAGGS